MVTLYHRRGKNDEVKGQGRFLAGNKIKQKESEAKDLSRHFSREDKPRAKKHMKRFSTLVVIWEMKVKITLYTTSQSLRWL